MREGWLGKQGGRIKTWKKRYVIISGNVLYYFKSPKDKAPAQPVYKSVYSPCAAPCRPLPPLAALPTSRPRAILRQAPAGFLPLENIQVRSQKDKCQFELAPQEIQLYIYAREQIYLYLLTAVVGCHASRDSPDRETARGGEGRRDREAERGEEVGGVG